MRKDLFLSVSATKKSPKWLNLIERIEPLYLRKNDIRTQFGRDYTRILHCQAYRRLKHKTQVFFNTANDHICTRIEHVNHVESVSYTIAKYLGLNVELTKAIAVGHDLGHAPFGHQGETVIKDLYIKYFEKSFWHEQNGLRFVDVIELLENDCRNKRNLNLTYAVRDGIISHCGEVDEEVLTPRTNNINLDEFTEKGKFKPYTWEACIVKIADKISYLGRDIEDAIRLGFIDYASLEELGRIADKYGNSVLNTTTIMHSLIIDLCTHSTPEKGLVFSKNNLYMLNEIKKYNYRVIYDNTRLDCYKEYARLVLTSIFNALHKTYNKEHTLDNLNELSEKYNLLVNGFSLWLVQYCSKDLVGRYRKLENKKIYGMLDTEQTYIQSIIDYISGMTDQYAITCFEELIKL